MVGVLLWYGVLFGVVVDRSKWSARVTLLLLNVSILQEGRHWIFSRGRIIKHESFFMEVEPACHTRKIGCIKMGLKKTYVAKSVITDGKLPKTIRSDLQKLKKRRLLREIRQEILQDNVRELITDMPTRVLALKSAKGISTKLSVFRD